MPVKKASLIPQRPSYAYIMNNKNTIMEINARDKFQARDYHRTGGGIETFNNPNFSGASYSQTQVWPLTLSVLAFEMDKISFICLENKLMTAIQEWGRHFTDLARYFPELN